MELNQQIINIIIGIIIILFGTIIAKILSKLIYNLLHKFSVNEIFSKVSEKNLKVEEFISGLFFYFIFVIIFLNALSFIGVSSFFLQLIATFLIFATIISLLLGFKDIIPNIFASYYILKKSNLKPGDYINVGNFEGEICKITLIETILKTDKKELVFIPNTYFITNLFILKEKPKKSIFSKFKYLINKRKKN